MYGYDKGTIDKFKRECWCDKCDDFVKPRIYIFETSISVVIDYECPICHEILRRIPRESKRK